jgi:hypothetical protein
VLKLETVESTLNILLGDKACLKMGGGNSILSEQRNAVLSHQQCGLNSHTENKNKMSFLVGFQFVPDVWSSNQNITQQIFAMLTLALTKTKAYVHKHHIFF